MFKKSSSHPQDIEWAMKKNIIKPDDMVDAVAVMITCAHTRSLNY